MVDEVRRCVAVVAYAMVNHRTPMSVFDFKRGGYHQVGVTYRGNFISIFDYGRSNYLSGYLPNLFDYYTAAYINLNVNGNTVNGFDYYTTSYFNITVNGNSVTIFDYQWSQYFMYSVN